MLCKGQSSRNDRKHFINRSGEIFINSNRKQGIIHPYLNNTGYNVIHFSDENGGFIVGIHVLLAEAFIPNPLNLPSVDHRNRIKTDNRLENLRWASYELQSQNRESQNENGTYGVYFDMNSKKWIAQLMYEGRNIYIGGFIDKDVAMHRRDQVAKHLNTQLNKYGEKNEYKLNFPTTKDLLHCFGRIWKRKLIKQT